jgi:hypothetical protein
MTRDNILEVLDWLKNVLLRPSVDVAAAIEAGRVEAVDEENSQLKALIGRCHGACGCPCHAGAVTP